MLEAVDQPVVDLVRDQDQVILLGDLRDLGQDLAAGDSAGGIAGIADKDGLGARSDGGPDARRIHLEVIFHAGGDLDRHAAGHDRPRAGRPQSRAWE